MHAGQFIEGSGYAWAFHFLPAKKLEKLRVEGSARFRFFVALFR
jgi:hypothetical protein